MNAEPIDEPVSPPRPGDVVAARYRLVTQLGEGGTGVVFAAWDDRLGRRVAVKLPTGPRALREHLGALLTREAQLASKLRSDHVVRIIDLGERADGTAFSVMELLDGETLGELLDRNGLPPREVAAQIAIEACAALAEVHEEGIVHRDVKPDNLVLARGVDGVTHVKLIDFGSSTYAQPDALAHDDRPVGTPAYMGPEQILRPERCDRRTDLWGVGMVLYEMLTGVLPFEAPSISDVFRKTVVGIAPPVRHYRPELPVELENVVMRCLARDPEDRFDDAATLADALAPFASYPEAAAEVSAVRHHCRTRKQRHHLAPTPLLLVDRAHDRRRTRPSAPLPLTRGPRIEPRAPTAA